MDALLNVNSLTKSFDDHIALRSIDLAVAAGEIVCLLGPSGCGKTTLLRTIAGLTLPDSGTVAFAGRDLAAVPPHKRDFGMMFQDFALFPHKSVYENVAFGLRMRGDSAEKVQQRVAEMLELVDMTAFAQRRIEQLSGGEQQRVALARSLAPGPRLLMLDEPLGALDRALRERLMLELRRILKQVGVTSIYVTHDQTEAFAIADRIVIMHAGRIEQIASPTVLYEHPATATVARFLGFNNVLPATIVASGVVDSTIGRFTVSTAGYEDGNRVNLLIKPDAIQAFHGNTSQNSLVGRVIAQSFRGRYVQLWLDCSGVTLMFELGSVTDLAVDESVTIALASDRLSVLPSD